jgi:hypothetical protein
METNAATQVTIEDLQAQVLELQSQVEVKNKQIDLISGINDKLLCTTTQVDAFLKQVTAEYVDPITGAWITINWYDFAKIKKGLSLLFNFVKTTLKVCYNKEFLPRIPSWLQLILS